ncbi:YjbH domain-containing protein [Falsihalocynthiibacter sp. CO-5D18]|uniref:YjbH domain-containing protein n=1 Tax=Falsihalocynthiibacter sp. CO-5D18 TaxID=3240872 RepID=UPI00351056BB
MLKRGLITSCVTALAFQANAQDGVAPTYNLYGTTGLIDMPSAQSAADGELAFAFSKIGHQQRNTLTFQITPRFSGSFRYTVTKDDGFSDGDNIGINFDRSFDLQYRFVDEGKYRPAISVGFRDILGTGQYGSEYFVATKNVLPTVRVTGGIGWGRMGTYNGFTNPLAIFGDSFKTRPSGYDEQGGEFNSGQWFKGNAAFFGGVEWRANEKLSLKAEYSSDAYTGFYGERSGIEHKSPFNFGLDYKVTENAHLAAYYAYGSTFALQFNYAVNPKNPPAPSGYDNAPTPVLVRPSRATNPKAWTTGWISNPETPNALEANMKRALGTEGLELEGFKYTKTSIVIHYRNNTYWTEAQAIGRAARAATRGLPNSVETLTLVPVVNGMATTAVTLNRTDMENLENVPDASWKSYVRANIQDAALLNNDGIRDIEDAYPNLTWGLGPYMDIGLFDPSAPFRMEIGAELSGTYEPSPGVLLSGALRKRVVGNLDDADRPSDSTLPHVRSDYGLYDKYGDPGITYLTAEYFRRPGPSLYTRVSAGLLEEMFAGVSGEILWKPTDSRLAMGLEMNYTYQRNYDQLFGMLDYSVATGHASAYYTFANGFYGQVDVGRYLAGDVGGTLSVAREFNNGWKIGAYATLTDVSSEDFGEGSFDKGITLEIPLFWALGRPNKTSQEIVIQPISRDGGARLNLSNRLFGLVSNQSEPYLSSQWARFWR